MAATVYTITGSGTSSNQTRLYTLNTTNGQTTLIGDTGKPGAVALAIHPVTGVLYMYVSANNNSTDAGLYSLNKSNATPTLIGSSGTGKSYADMSFNLADNTLYAIDSTSGNLDTINISTGATATFHASAGSGFVFGLAFDRNNTLWFKDGNIALYNIVLSPYAKNFVVNISNPFNGNTMNNCLAFDENNIMYSLNRFSSSRTDFYTINASTGVATLLGENTTSGHFSAIAVDYQSGVASGDITFAGIHSLENWGTPSMSTTGATPTVNSFNLYTANLDNYKIKWMSIDSTYVYVLPQDYYATHTTTQRASVIYRHLQSDLSLYDTTTYNVATDYTPVDSIDYNATDTHAYSHVTSYGNTSHTGAATFQVVKWDTSTTPMTLLSTGGFPVDLSSTINTAMPNSPASSVVTQHCTYLDKTNGYLYIGYYYSGSATSNTAIVVQVNLSTGAIGTMTVPNTTNVVPQIRSITCDETNNIVYFIDAGNYFVFKFNGSTLAQIGSKLDLSTLITQGVMTVIYSSNFNTLYVIDYGTYHLIDAGTPTGSMTYGSHHTPTVPVGIPRQDNFLAYQVPFGGYYFYYNLSDDNSFDYIQKVDTVGPSFVGQMQLVTNPSYASSQPPSSGLYRSNSIVINPTTYIGYTTIWTSSTSVQGSLVSFNLNEPAGGGGGGDPHFVGFDGKEFDYHGESGKKYLLYKDDETTITALFEETKDPDLAGMTFMKEITINRDTYTPDTICPMDDREIQAQTGLDRGLPSVIGNKIGGYVLGLEKIKFPKGTLFLTAMDSTTDLHLNLSIQMNSRDTKATGILGQTLLPVDERVANDTFSL